MKREVEIDGKIREFDWDETMGKQINIRMGKLNFKVQEIVKEVLEGIRYWGNHGKRSYRGDELDELITAVLIQKLVEWL